MVFTARTGSPAVVVDAGVYLWAEIGRGLRAGVEFVVAAVRSFVRPATAPVVTAAEVHVREAVSAGWPASHIVTAVNRVSSVVDAVTAVARAVQPALPGVLVAYAVAARLGAVLGAGLAGLVCVAGVPAAVTVLRAGLGGLFEFADQVAADVEGPVAVLGAAELIFWSRAHAVSALSAVLITINLVFAELTITAAIPSATAIRKTVFAILVRPFTDVVAAQRSAPAVEVTDVFVLVAIADAVAAPPTAIGGAGFFVLAPERVADVITAHHPRAVFRTILACLTHAVSAWLVIIEAVSADTVIVGVRAATAHTAEKQQPG